MYNNILRVLDELCPMREQVNVKRKAEWISAELLELMKARDVMFKRARKTKNVDDWSEAKSYRNRVNDACSRAKNEFIKARLQEDEGNPQKFWEHLSPLMGKGGKTKSDTFELDEQKNDGETADIFN